MELSALIILIQLYWIPAVIVAYIIASFLVVLSVYHGQSRSLFLYRFLHPRTSLAIHFSVHAFPHLAEVNLTSCKCSLMH